MRKLLEVAEGILDGAASEYRETNLADAVAVQQYADAAMGIDLALNEAEQVLSACKAWVTG